ncbi:MAG: hypothetical protein ACYS5V_01145, partial [Planctomycetota bacterium]
MEPSRDTLRTHRPRLERLEDRLLLAAVPATMTSAQAESFAYFHNDGDVHDSLAQTAHIGSTSDVDSWVFAGDTGWDGTYTFRVYAASPINASVGVYDGATGAALRRLTFGSSTYVAFSQTGMTGVTEYVFAVGDAANGAGISLDVVIESPGSATPTVISLDPAGDGSYD